MDFLVSADLLVVDVDAGVRTFVDLLGFDAPEPGWRGGGEGHGFDVTFLRPQRSLKAAPTRLEIMAPAGLSPDVPGPRTLPHVPGLFAAQQRSKVRTHGTVLATAHITDYIAKAQAAGARHWLDAANELVPFHRLWVGVSEQQKDVWIPGDDGGLLLELVESQSMPGVAESADLPDPTRWTDLAAGSMVRISARRWLVPDLAASSAALSASLGVELTEAHASADARATVCELRPRHPRSAVVQLVEPGNNHPDCARVAELGPQPDAIVVEVNDLDAKANDLLTRGAAITRCQDPVDGTDSVAVEPAQTFDVPVRFVAAHAPTQDPAASGRS